MKTFKQYLFAEAAKKQSESKKKAKSSKDDTTNQISAIMELAEKIQSVFKKYSLKTRRDAWDKIHTKKGDDAIADLMKNPYRSLNSFKKLSNQGK